ncbi:MAG: lysophospholipid acyltransferase family protein [Alphaproteobacteria bacterium]|nr:lysophospholipid acyltransferase family protein [Alphaproteobacteria bacterium]
MKLKLLKKIFRTPLAEKFLGISAYYYLKFVGLTTRWQVKGVEETYKILDECGAMIVVGWHGRTLEMPYFWNKSRPLNALVSPHRDGKIIVKILEKFGIGHISGSSNKNSTEAAFELMSNLNAGNSIAIIPDGPLGPSMQMSLSPLFYAQKSGKPIIGITYSIAGSYIVTKSWDNMLLPLPFHKGMYAITSPFFVPEDATREDLDKYRKQLENQLNELTWELDKEMGLPFIPQGTVAKKYKKNILERK